jgi:hypothetical protein
MEQHKGLARTALDIVQPHSVNFDELAARWICSFRIASHPAGHKRCGSHCACYAERTLNVPRLGEASHLKRAGLMFHEIFPDLRNWPGESPSVRHEPTDVRTDGSAPDVRFNLD